MRSAERTAAGADSARETFGKRKRIGHDGRCGEAVFVNLGRWRLNSIA